MFMMAIRFAAIVLVNLITLPLQVAFLMIYFLTKWNEEERQYLDEFFDYVYKNDKHWIETGDFDFED